MVSPLPTLTRAQGYLVTSLLRDKKVRTREGAFIIEGAKFCQDVIRRYPGSVRSLVLSPRYLSSEDEDSRSARSSLSVNQFTCADEVFDKLSDVEAPQGILAVVRQPAWDEAKIWAQGQVLGLYGEQLRDPLNVGAIIRTAAALNLTGLWLSTDSADCFGPKVVRAAAGSVLALPIFRIRDIRTFLDHRCAIYSAVVSSTDSVSLRILRHVPRHLVIAVGNEARGLTGDLLKASTLKFSIPLARDVESLNVAATAAIASFVLSGLPVQP